MYNTGKPRETAKYFKPYIIQLLHEVEHDILCYQRGLCYLKKPKAEADNTNRGLITQDIMRKPNSIIILLYTL